MRILITGIPGWLGNRFLEILIAGFENHGPVNDWKIRCFMLDKGTLPVAGIKAGPEKIEYIYGDVTKPETLRTALKNVDLVFHLAGVIHPDKIKLLYAVNTTGTASLLRESSLAGVKRFIYISSNSVAGTNLARKTLMKETDTPRPYLHYGLSKYKAELLIKETQDAGKMETVILRPCWFYGPHQPDRQTRFFRMIKKGTPLVFGNGENLRSLSYVDNVCQAMLLSAENKTANGQTYWIADALPYSCNQIYKTIADLLGVKNFFPRHIPGSISNICYAADTLIQAAGGYIKEIHVAGEMNKDIACSIEKARKEIGFNPTIGLEEGMRRSIKWCYDNGITL